MKELILGSHNPHKIHEFGLIAPDFSFSSPAKYGLTEGDSFEEVGRSFFENAYGKAEQIHRLIFDRTGKRVPVLADDSGICVEAFVGAPGIYSARYGSEIPNGPRTDAERTAFMLKNLDGKANRNAHYVCCLVCYVGPDRFLSAQETWEGVLAETLSAGTTGFGYDPIFLIPPTMTPVAEITEQEKASISHRAKAFNAIRQELIQL